MAHLQDKCILVGLIFSWVVIPNLIIEVNHMGCLLFAFLCPYQMSFESSLGI